MPDDLAFASASELRRRITAREVSPGEVLEACLRQVEEHNPAINAVVTLNPRARQEAAAIEDRLAKGKDPGLLASLPVAIKDITDTSGLRTTYGCQLYRQHVPVEDAEVVRRLKAAGAVVLGKTNIPELAAGGYTCNDLFGSTKNPWNPLLSAGGSTGGGAAALACGMAPLAQGTDLGGSLRIPAAFCGVVGLRPTPGLVPVSPTPLLWDSLDVTGPMARHAEDVALMLQAIAGPTPKVPMAQPIHGRDFPAAVHQADPRGLSIAYCPDMIGIGIAEDLETRCRAAALRLRQLGAEVEEIELDLAYAREAYLTLRGVWMVAEHYERLEQLDQLGNNVAGNIRSGLEITTQELAAAEAGRLRLWQQMRELLERFDHLLSPCLPVSPFPVEQSHPETVAGRPMESYVDWFATTFVLSLSALPVASVPCGLDAQNMPVGLQIVGRPRAEESVLALAKVVQDSSPMSPYPCQ